MMENKQVKKKLNSIHISMEQHSPRRTHLIGCPPDQSGPWDGNKRNNSNERVLSGEKDKITIPKSVLNTLSC